MAAIEFWARVGADHTLAVPPEVAARIDGNEPIRVVVYPPGSNEQQAWDDLSIDEFLRGYDPGDDIDDDVPIR